MTQNEDNQIIVNTDVVIKKYLMLSFVIFSIVISAIGYFVYESYYHDISKKIEEELTTVSKLKVEEIEHWRKERIKNLSIYQNDLLFGEMVKKTLSNPNDAEIQKKMKDWMVLFKTNYEYHRVCLHDINGTEILSTNEGDASLPHNLKTYFNRIFIKREVVFENFYIEKTDGRIYLSLIVGIFDIIDNNKPIGVLIARVDPNEYLYPHLNGWPIPRESAESYLVYRDSGEVVFLNDLKHQKGTALNLKFNIEMNQNLPAVQAVKGFSGIYNGLDCNNQPVISYLIQIPDTPWYIVSKIDKNETTSLVNRILASVILVVFLLISVLTMVIFYVHRYQKYSYYRESAKKLKEEQEKLEMIVKDRTQDLSLLNEELKTELERKIRDEKEKDRLRLELQHSQKMQSIGTLAAGIAHEINSPLQYTNDNVDFITKSFEEIMRLVSTYKNLMMSCHTDEDKEKAKILISELEKKINLSFLATEMPDALSQTKDGISRIRKIVNAMKQYSHFNNEEKKPADINQTLENAEIITRNEWKYHAEIENNFSTDLPFVNCYEAELNQVFMNLLVNAGHTIKDAIDRKNITQGKIIVTSAYKNNKILVSISDNGMGIPEKFRDRIYDYFFTTKEVGKGTGQGLAIAHKTIVEKHGGKLWFETEVNKGTTFFVEVPV